MVFIWRGCTPLAFTALSDVSCGRAEIRPVSSARQARWPKAKTATTGILRMENAMPTLIDPSGDHLHGPYLALLATLVCLDVPNLVGDC